jgi:hypothetical protein
MIQGWCSAFFWLTFAHFKCYYYICSVRLFYRKSGHAENGYKWREWNFAEVTLERGLKGVLLTCFKEKLDRRWLVQSILKFSDFVLFWWNTAKTSNLHISNFFQALCIKDRALTLPMLSMLMPFIKKKNFLSWISLCSVLNKFMFFA